MRYTKTNKNSKEAVGQRQSLFLLKTETDRSPAKFTFPEAAFYVFFHKFECFLKKIAKIFKKSTTNRFTSIVFLLKI
jgi:hypothetical protein